MARAHNLRQRDSVLVSDEDEGLVPTEPADRDASRSPVRGLLDLGASQAAPASRSAVVPLAGDGDILATLVLWLRRQTPVGWSNELSWAESGILLDCYRTMHAGKDCGGALQGTGT